MGELKIRVALLVKPSPHALDCAFAPACGESKFIGVAEKGKSKGGLEAGIEGADGGDFHG